MKNTLKAHYKYLKNPKISNQNPLLFALQTANRRQKLRYSKSDGDSFPGNYSLTRRRDELRRTQSRISVFRFDQKMASSNTKEKEEFKNQSYRFRFILGNVEKSNGA